MRKWLVCLMLLSLVSLSVLPAVSGALPTPQVPPINRQPSSPGGVPANWTSNRVENSGFENWTTPGDAAAWAEDRSGDLGTWYAEAPDPVQSGTYSAGMQVESPSTGGNEFTYFSQGDPYLNIGLGDVSSNLTFWWYSDQTQNIGSDALYLSVLINNSKTLMIMRYYLNGTTSFSNMSYAAFFNLGGPTQQWNRFSRNLTADYEAVAEFPVLSPSAEVCVFMFVLESAADTTQVNRAFIDNLVFENATTVFVNSSIRNGDFETNTEWGIGYHGNEEGYVTRSPTAHLGSYSCNLTAASNQRVSNAYIASNPCSRLTSLNPGTLSFWWYLDFENLPSYSFAWVYVSLNNGTAGHTIRYMLGGRSTFTNQVDVLYLNVENFNTTGSWFYFNRSIWQDAWDYFGSDEVRIQNLRFQVEGRGDSVDSRVTLLVDEVEQIAGAVNGAGFEDQPAVGSHIRGWGGYYYTTDDSLRVTSTAYAGNKAAHLSVNSSSVFGDYQPLGGRPIRGSRNTYLDVAWRLVKYTPAESDFACLYVRFGDGKYLYYYFAITSDKVLYNGTIYGYFNVTGVNTGQTWHLMQRCLSTDYEAVFGHRPDTLLHTLHLYANASGGHLVELLFDDLYIYDVGGPINPLLLLLPIIVAVVVIIIVVVALIIFVWYRRRSK